jgi:hypothetical protein
MLFTIEFVWTVPHDDNRLQDGLDLRTEFSNEQKIRLEKGATVLEVLIALSRRLAFTAGGRAEDWAWQLLANLRLTKMTDPFTENKARKVANILETLIGQIKIKPKLRSGIKCRNTSTRFNKYLRS